MENQIEIKGVICSKEEAEFMQLFEPGFVFTTLESVEEQLTLTTSRNIELLIDSHGGNIEEGYKIYNHLKLSGKKITSNIKFACYSTATFIALVASKVIISQYARFGIHNPYYPPGCGIGGDANELEREAAKLRKYEDEFARLYAAKTGKSFEEIKALMNENSEFTAQEALALGFVDEIAGGTTEEAAQAAARMRFGAIAYFKNTNIKNSDMSEVKLSQEDKSLFKEIGEGLKALKDKFIGSPKGEGETPPEETTAAPTVEQLTAENEALKAENESLKAEVETLKARIAELEGTTEEATQEAAAVKTEVQALQTKFNAMAEKLSVTFGSELNLAPEAQDVSKGRKKPEAGSKADLLAEGFKGKFANRLKNK